MSKPKKILIAPLDWGIGHVTRCIPLILFYKSLGHQIDLACNENQRCIIEAYTDDIDFIPLKGYQISYAKHKSLFNLKIVLQIPKIVSSIIQEHIFLKKLVKESKYDLIISDNRYGFFHRKIKSHIITHQLQIQAPNSFSMMLINGINRFLINRFDSCWVPDYHDAAMSGQLSNNKGIQRIAYLGNLSRLQLLENLSIQYDILILLSGPEPQRTLLEKKLIEQLPKNKRIAFVRGCITTTNLPNIGHVSFFDFLSGTALNQLICQSACVICRSAYSTLMDLIKLNKHAILIPTSGQTEQEYLANHFEQQNWSMQAQQENLDLEKSYADFLSKTFFPYPKFNFEQYKNVLLEAII
ncbi:MAG: glycosyltransferase [Chitinophagaceae bacterium]